MRQNMNPISRLNINSIKQQSNEVIQKFKALSSEERSFILGAMAGLEAKYLTTTHTGQCQLKGADFHAI